MARETCAQPETFVLIDPDSDTDVRPQIAAFVTKTAEGELSSHRFECFSKWKTVCQATVPKSSPLRKLSPFVDVDGVSRRTHALY